VATVNVSLNSQSNKLSAMASANTEALATPEGNGPCSNFKSHEYTILTGIISWTHYTCCVNGTDIDGCNFNLEDDWCKKNVKRNARPSNC
jgi:hypothetical protein